MTIQKIDENAKTLTIVIPLTENKGKTRVKKRSSFNEYGISIAAKRETFSQNCYVEWQIGYDVPVADEEKLKLTSLKDKIFTGANGKTKTLYELSEYMYYFYIWGIIAKEQLIEIKTFLAGLKASDLIYDSGTFSIERSQPVERPLLNIDFAYTQVKYPMLIHKFGASENLTEIKMTEKQYAVGIQPMLYFCFPVTQLKSDVPIIGRTAKTNETAEFIIDSGNISVFLEILKIFGILSAGHNQDILAIIERIVV